MKSEPLGFLPEARRQGIVSKEVEGELLVYDRVRDKAHCFNSAAAAIWKRCNGRASANQIAASLAREKGGTTDERVVWLALEEFRRAHLLKEPGRWPGQTMWMTGLSRREAIRRIGLSAAIALPIVVSITAPAPAQAGTCKPNNSFCSTGSECCSGVCQSQPTGPPKCLGG